MKKIFASLAVLSFLLIPAGIQAIDLDSSGYLENARKEAKYDDKTPLPILIAKIVNVGLGLIGTVFTVLIVYGGFLWMTASGNTDQVAKAKTTIQNAAFGLVIVLTAYSITTFVTGALTKATGLG